MPRPRPNQERGTCGSAAGSYQREESIGSSVKLTYSETSTANPTVMPNWKKKRPMMPPMKATGNEDGDDGEGGGHHGQADFGGGLARGGEVVGAGVHVAHDVLAHHDGVVDQQADGQRQPHQREDVQREAQGAHDDERADDGDRQRQPRDHRAAPAIQEQEDDEDGEEAAEHQRDLHVVHRVADEGGAVHHRAQADVRGQFAR